ncbi:FhuE receptor precursor [mine drainage metagenome]|uniref:FhuE receptor n=1 Tax=mine drainage metagenome TaxID=410659 RepID=A0A1J5TSQ5_9ZZZZ
MSTKVPIKRRPTLHLLAVLVSAIAGYAGAFAQTAATASSSQTADSQSKDDDTIVLSPFTVNTTKDTGYKATNSLGGTKMNTPIKDLPFTLDVVTSDFLRDIGALSVADGLAYTAGVMPTTSPGTNSPDMSVRGFPSNFYLRDGIPVYRAPDWTMVDRIEVIRGASAIVYGQTQAGGVINITTKHADVDKRFGSVSQLVGQWSNYVTTVDINQPLVAHKLAVRFAGSITDAGGRRQGSGTKGSLVFPSLTWKPTPRTTVSLQFSRDISDARGLNAGAPINYATSHPGFQHIDKNYTAYYNSLTPTQRVLYTLPTPDTWMSTNNPGQVGGPAPIFLKNPYTYNIGGDQGYWDSDVKTSIASLSQVLVEDGSGLIKRSDLKLTLSRTNDAVRGSIPLTGSPNPQGQRGANTSWAASDGTTGATWALTGQTGYYFDYNEPVVGAKNFAGSNFYFPVDLTNPSNAHVVPLVGPDTYAWYTMYFHLANINDVASVDTVTDLDLGSHTKARILFGYEHSRQRYWDPSRKGNLPLATGNTLADQENNYLRGLKSPGGWSSTTWGPAPGNGTMPLPNWGYGFTGIDQQNPGTLYGAGADRAYRGWNLVNLDTGERRAAHVSAADIAAIVDKYYYGLSQDIFSDAFYLSGQLDLFDKKVSVLGAVRYTDIEKKDYRVEGNVPSFPQRYNPVVPQVGVIYNLTRHVNLYASYARNYWYEWSRQTNAINQAPPPNTAESVEVGSKFELFNGRISGSASVYQTKMHNLSWTDNTFDLTAYDPARYPQHPKLVNNSMQLVDQYGLGRFDGEVENKGVELNLQASPVDAWNIVLSYSYIDSKYTRAAPWMVGVTPTGVAKNMASLWNRYTLSNTTGLLKGLEFGVGVVYHDPVWVGEGYNQAAISGSSYVWRTPVFVRFDAEIGYPFKAAGYDCRVQLNVKNLADRTNWTADGNFIPDGQGREFMGRFIVNF